MSAYFQETERAFGYIFVDNRPETQSDKQVLSDISGSCRRYSTIKAPQNRSKQSKRPVTRKTLPAKLDQQ